MLRITVGESEGLITVKLEGKLKGAWVKELERVWSNIPRSGQRQAVQVDLAAVDFVDARGKALLARLCRSGAELRATDPMMKAVIDEVAQFGAGAAAQ